MKIILKNILLKNLLLLCVATTTLSLLSCIPPVPKNSTIKVAIVTDFDGVVVSLNLRYIGQLIARYWYRGYVVLNPSFLKDAYAAVWSADGLYDRQGNKVIGGWETVDYFIQNWLPWATQKDRDRLFGAVSAYNPIHNVIDLYQKYQNRGIPVCVWTNNDQKTYDVKLEMIAQKRKNQGNAPLIPSGAFTSQVMSERNKDEHVRQHKPHPDYYKRAYEWTCEQLNANPGELHVIFIDDNVKNVVGATRAAELYNLPITALHYAKDARKLEKEITSTVGELYLANRA
jgi:beta-phosphoglucomutase-like phosphatase (HAD superfamily)